MKKTNARVLVFQRHLSPLIGLLVICLLLSPARVSAPVDPPLCNVGIWEFSLFSGGIRLNLAQAHIGDNVPVFPILTSDPQACRAINVTGSVWIATGRITNFLMDVILDPGVLIFCPTNALCQPGPYNILITPALIGAGVSTPNGSIPGVARTVRVAENSYGFILNGDPPEELGTIHTATISIVTPCIQVVEQCIYPAGTSCFSADAPVQFTGYVTNCGDIRLTNVTVAARNAPLLTTNGMPLSQPLTLDPGQAVGFQWGFRPAVEEIAAGSATSTLLATARDTTTIGGPNAFVTNGTLVVCAICPNPVLESPAYTANNQFQFNLTGRAGANYVIQVSTNLGTGNWLSLGTNTGAIHFCGQQRGGLSGAVLSGTVPAVIGSAVTIRDLLRAASFKVTTQ